MNLMEQKWFNGLEVVLVCVTVLPAQVVVEKLT
jgi:hypothetical protein